MYIPELFSASFQMCIIFLSLSWQFLSFDAKMRNTVDSLALNDINYCYQLNSREGFTYFTHDVKWISFARNVFLRSQTPITSFYLRLHIKVLLFQALSVCGASTEESCNYGNAFCVLILNEINKGKKSCLLAFCSTQKMQLYQCVRRISSLLLSCYLSKCYVYMA